MRGSNEIISGKVLQKLSKAVGIAQIVVIVFQPDAKRKIWFQPCPDQLPVRLPGRSPVLCSPRRPHHRHPQRGRRGEKSFVSRRMCVFLLSRCHNRIIIFMIVVFHRRRRLRFYQSSRCFYRHGVRWAEAPGTRLSLSISYSH